MTLFEPEKTHSDAVISPDGAERYSLTRWWGPHDEMVTWIMLNPSTADATADDPTIRRCVGYARAWGYAGIMVGNLYAHRATSPAELTGHRTPDAWNRNAGWLTTLLTDAARADTPVVAAWGTHATPPETDWILQLPGSDRLTCLGLTKAGAPKHPLYVKGTAQLQAWPNPCPATSPETGRICVLPDTAESHTAGHRSMTMQTVRVGWPTRLEDHNRWRNTR